ncbi:MAG TPA: rRNA maturation RNase YbeY [Ferruginibacter sp.]|nr:rRNA maturation RNase YbeY [Ferruginibacter sp.]HMP19888.1 rRNA maturation RNase YbeY [Ferruginibacter sp.]
MIIQFFFEGVRPSLTNRNALKSFLTKMAISEGRGIESLNYVFCSDEYLLQINKNYLSHNYFTDIITFDLADTNKASIIGDIYISTDRVKDNARVLKTTIKAELLRVIFHGLLHLCGYTDKTTMDKLLMRQAEDKYLMQYLGNSFKQKPVSQRTVSR